MNPLKKMAVCFSLIALVGCIPRTHTLIPEFSGRVVDAYTLESIDGVDVREITREGPDTSDIPLMVRKTADDGAFQFAAHTAGNVAQLPTAGAGWPVSRTLLFAKDGYQSMRCEAANMSLFGEPNASSIYLVPGGDAVDMRPKPLLLQVGDVGIRCEPIAGHPVRYQGADFIVEGVSRQPDEKSVYWIELVPAEARDQESLSAPHFMVVLDFAEPVDLEQDPQ